jgi:arylformamidase
MPAIDLEAEYNNRARVPEHPAVIQSWKERAAAWRERRGTDITRDSFGPSPRQTLDVFPAPASAGGLAPVLFIHGGYWQALDPSFFGHMAEGLNARGVDVAIAGYDLCPDVSVADILRQCGEAERHLSRRVGKPVVVTGHSAGGHLAACLAADPALPVKAGLGISGLYELEPLVPTSVNAKLGLDFPEARRLSPRLMAPVAGRPFEAWVGAAESDEYLRQSRTLAAVWAAHGVRTGYEEVPGANHFTVIGELERPDSPMTARLAAMAAG